MRKSSMPKKATPRVFLEAASRGARISARALRAQGYPDREIASILIARFQEEFADSDPYLMETLIEAVRLGIEGALAGRSPVDNN